MISLLVLAVTALTSVSGITTQYLCSMPGVDYYTTAHQITWVPTNSNETNYECYPNSTYYKAICNETITPSTLYEPIYHTPRRFHRLSSINRLRYLTIPKDHGQYRSYRHPLVVFDVLCVGNQQRYHRRHRSYFDTKRIEYKKNKELEVVEED
jgi:hypothetical protein